MLKTTKAIIALSNQTTSNFSMKKFRTQKKFVTQPNSEKAKNDRVPNFFYAKIFRWTGQQTGNFNSRLSYLITTVPMISFQFLFFMVLSLSSPGTHQLCLLVVNSNFLVNGTRLLIQKSQIEVQCKGQLISYFFYKYLSQPLKGG